VETRDDPVTHEALDAGVSIGTRDVQPLGERADRRPTVADQRVDEPPVDVVEPASRLSRDWREFGPGVGILAHMVPLPAPDVPSLPLEWRQSSDKLRIVGTTCPGGGRRDNQGSGTHTPDPGSASTAPEP
jgi:hypothetical protein